MIDHQCVSWNVCYIAKSANCKRAGYCIFVSDFLLMTTQRWSRLLNISKRCMDSQFSTLICLAFKSETRRRRTIYQWRSEIWRIRFVFVLKPVDGLIYSLFQACKIVEGQRYTKRLSEKQITSLLKVTCQRPRDRENDILQVRDAGLFTFHLLRIDRGLYYGLFDIDHNNLNHGISFSLCTLDNGIRSWMIWNNYYSKVHELCTTSSLPWFGNDIFLYFLAMQTVQHNAYDQDPYAKEFGIRISEKLASVEARVLPAPWVRCCICKLAIMSLKCYFYSWTCVGYYLQLKYHETGKEKDCLPQVGQWNMMNKVSLLDILQFIMLQNASSLCFHMTHHGDFIYTENDKRHDC